MCDVCKSAGDELKSFLNQLVEKYPGSTVEYDGTVYPVSRVHHVFVGLQVAAQDIIREEFEYIAQRQEEKAGLSGQLSSLFGGAKADKEIWN